MPANGSGKWTQKSLVVSSSGYFVVRMLEPEVEPKAAIMIASAMGVAQNFYAEFAEWLVTQGYAVATFDCRGIGVASDAKRSGKVSVSSWMNEEYARVIDLMKERLPTKPLYLVGHSLGGQVIGLIPNRGKIDAVVTIGSGSGYWQENAPKLRRYVLFLWYVIAPIAVTLFGYFPGKRLGIIGNLPRAVVEQWRRWCLNPRYVVGVEGPTVEAKYAAFERPILALSFSDDEMMSLQGVHTLHGFYRSARIRIEHIAPTKVAAERIGHFGFFRSEFKHSLWPKVRQWFESAQP